MNTQTLAAPALPEGTLNTSSVEPLQPVASAEHLQESWRRYQQLKAQILRADDYQTIQTRQGKKRFLKKSGYRKLATAFSLSTAVIHETRRDLKTHFVYETTCKAVAPNGRYATACAGCASNERDFAHPDNDTRAISQTRATNRAIGDLLGESVSAEEMETPRSSASTHVTVTPPAKKSVRMITLKQRRFLVDQITKRVRDPQRQKHHIQRVERMTLAEAAEAVQKTILQINANRNTPFQRS